MGMPSVKLPGNDTGRDASWAVLQVPVLDLCQEFYESGGSCGYLLTGRPAAQGEHLHGANDRLATGTGRWQ